MKKAIILGVALSMSVLTKAQTITGTVVDSKGNPMPGAKVEVSGNNSNCVLTDMDGKFTIDANGRSVTSTYVGWASKTEKAADGMEIKMRKNNPILSWRPARRQFFIGFAPAFGNGFAPGLILGTVKNAGWYTKLQFSGVPGQFADAPTFRHNSSYYRSVTRDYGGLTGGTQDRYASITFGYLKRVYGPIYVNVGNGISSFSHMLETANGEYMYDKDCSRDYNFTVDFGVMVRYNNFFLQGGAQANIYPSGDDDFFGNSPCFMQGTISVGYAF